MGDEIKESHYSCNECCRMGKLRARLPSLKFLYAFGHFAIDGLCCEVFKGSWYLPLMIMFFVSLYLFFITR